MNSYRLFLISIWALLLLIVVAFVVMQNGQQPDNEHVTQFPETNDGTVEVVDVTDKFTVLGKDGTQVEVRDFLKDTSVVKWGDSYVIAEDVDVKRDLYYQIFYFPMDRSISVALLQEPLSLSRNLAERALHERLMLSQDVLCKLDINVSTPSFVSDTFSGRDLGLSFCPGAIQLE